MNRDLNPDLCDDGAVIFQLSYQANWVLVVMWIAYELEDYGYKSVCLM